jgi:hypothetical protein
VKQSIGNGARLRNQDDLIIQLQTPEEQAKNKSSPSKDNNSQNSVKD